MWEKLGWADPEASGATGTGSSAAPGHWQGSGLPVTQHSHSPSAERPGAPVATVPRTLTSVHTPMASSDSCSVTGPPGPTLLSTLFAQRSWRSAQGLPPDAALSARIEAALTAHAGRPRPPWAWRAEPMALAGGDFPESVCSHLGGEHGGAWPLLQFLNAQDAAALRCVCTELRSMTEHFLVHQRRRGAVWDWPLGKLQGRVSRLAGSGEQGSSEGMGAAALFMNPTGLAVRPDGSVVVADCCNNTIRLISAAGVVSTLAGAAHVQGSTDGQGSAACFFWPTGVVLCPDGSLLVADYGSHTIRRVSAAGLVSTVAGAGRQAGASDGAGALARFNNPHGLALGPDGSLFISDSENYSIRCLSADGSVRTVAGAAEEIGSADGLAPAARFSWPKGLAAAPDGRLYVADTYNNTIRCISAAGVVSTLAGLDGEKGSADGPGAEARFNEPTGLALGPEGSLYVADTGNHTIRCISPAGVVSTLAGAAGQEGCVDGRGPAARFSEPEGVAVGPDGSLYVADHHSVRRIT